MRTVTRAAVIGAALALAVGAGAAAQGTANTTYLVFLRDGRALASHGEYANIGDRVVFTMAVGGEGVPIAYETISLPVDRVDLPRTEHYADGVRAAHYAATRGETEFAAISEEVSRVLDDILGVSEPDVRLALAQQARRRLIDWSNANYGYRAEEIRELTALFDQVIAQLRAATGASDFALSLSAGPGMPDFEPLRTKPGLRESIEMALSASTTADTGADRLALVRVALGALESPAGSAGAFDGLRGRAYARLGEEMIADQAYGDLARDIIARARAAASEGDVAGVAALRDEAGARDRTLGQRRPQEMASLFALLDRTAEHAREQRAALLRYHAVRDELLRYEREIRAGISGMEGLWPVFNNLRDYAFVSVDRVKTSSARVDRFGVLFDRVRPPAELSDVHSTFVSAINLARQACEARRLYAVTSVDSYNDQASAAAAGAQLLFDRAHQELVKRLFPPTLK